MSRERRCQFIIPTCVLFCSLFWGAIVDPNIPLRPLLNDFVLGGTGGRALAAIVAGAVGFVGLGFLLQVLHRNFEHRLEDVFGRDYRARLTDGTMKKIEAALGHQVRLDRRPIAIESYIHGTLSKESPALHERLMGRWASFQTSTQCRLALVLSIALGIGLDLAVLTTNNATEYVADFVFWKWIFLVGLLWWIPVFILREFIQTSAESALNEYWSMIEFQFGNGDPKGAATPAPAPALAPRPGPSPVAPPKQAAPIKAAPTNASSKKSAPTKAAPKKAAPKKAASKKVAPKRAAPAKKRPAKK